MQPLREWDETVIQTIALPGESDEVEKKSALALDHMPKSELRAEIAKQVCAFANAGNGFLVFGINDAGGLDSGVPALRGHTPIVDWIEGMIPSLVYPPVTNCTARYIRCRAHAPDRGVLVLSIPLSDRRPHWSTESQERAYIRVGAHSLEMRRQTFLDIHSRGIAPQGEIVDLGISPATVAPALNVDIRLNPQVRIASGPMCDKWAFEIKIGDGPNTFVATSGSGMSVYNNGLLVCIERTTPLFPGRITPVALDFFAFRYYSRPQELDDPIGATLYPASAPPVFRTFKVRELIGTVQRA
jgi:Schlafen, AlbA_2